MTPQVRLARRLPSITQLAVGALGLVIVGGVYMASYFPRRPPLGLPIALLAGSAAAFAIGVVLLAGVPDFAWDTFFSSVAGPCWPMSSRRG